jgi:hypothetical protein
MLLTTNCSQKGRRGQARIEESLIVCSLVSPWCTHSKVCPCLYSHDDYVVALHDIDYVETHVGVNAMWLYASLLAAAASIAVLISHSVCSILIVSIYAGPVCSSICLALFLLSKQRVLSIGVVPGSPDEGSGASNPLDSSPFWIKIPLSEKMEDLIPTLCAAQQESSRRGKEHALNMGTGQHHDQIHVAISNQTIDHVSSKSLARAMVLAVCDSWTILKNTRFGSLDGTFLLCR